MQSGLLARMMAAYLWARAAIRRHLCSVHLRRCRRRISAGAAASTPSASQKSAMQSPQKQLSCRSGSGVSNQPAYVR